MQVLFPKHKRSTREKTNLFTIDCQYLEIKNVFFTRWIMAGADFWTHFYGRMHKIKSQPYFVHLKGA